MDVLSNRVFTEQKSTADSVLLLAHATAGAELDDAVQTVIGRHLDVDHFSVFGQAPLQQPVVLAAGGRDRDGVSPALARAYAARFCRWDPVASDMQACATMDQVFVHRRRAEDVRNTSYRHECYDKPGITERLTICSATGATWRMLHLYRMQRSPSFTEAERTDAIRAAACILTALPTGPATGSKRRLPWFVERLGRLPAGLTRRERDVCARALLGMTVEGTALDLGVAPTSVATYRKRAYQKLNITSQNEMFALLC